MRRAAFLLVLVLAAGCGRPVEGESPVTGGSSSSEAVMSAVHGVVLDGDGRPVAGQAVAVISLDDPPLAVPELAVITADDGRFEWPSLRPGRYRVGAARGGGEPVTADVVVPPSGPGPEVQIRLR